MRECVLSVYNEATGITYIMPGSLRGLFESVRAEEAPAQTQSDDVSSYLLAQESEQPAAEDAPLELGDG